jgi:hypothetical protein
MPRVCWSDGATDDLLNVVEDRALMEQLRDNAEITLHQITNPTPDEGVKGPTMWHRGFTHDQERQINEGTLPEGAGPQVWDYFLLYQLHRRPGCEFRVVQIWSTSEMAARWLRMQR